MEDLDFEIEFYEDLLRVDPGFSDAWAPLAEAYTRKGYYGKGLELDRKLADLLPWDPTVFYNLACSFALLGQTGPALNALERALQLGYRDFDWMEEDVDLENIRDSNQYKSLVKKYRNYTLEE